MYTNDAYFYNFLNLDGKNIGVYHLNRPLLNLEISEKNLEVFNAEIKCSERDAVILMSHEGNLSLPIVKNLPSNVFCFDTVGNIDHERYCTYFHWFGTSRAIEQTGFAMQYLLDHTVKYPKYRFDCLLGLVRPHREFVYNNINSGNFKDQFLVSYYGKTKIWLPGSDIDADPDLKGSEYNFEELSLPIKINNIDDSSYWVAYNQRNTTCMLSQLLPWRIYNDSWYSIITESFVKFDLHSEKTANALLGGRIFVVFSGKGALRSLRRAGFQTFGDIIDESYDDIDDVDLRHRMAWQQVEFLCQSDPHEIYKKFSHITQHNQRHFMNTDWDDQFRQNAYRLLGI
jgi:hypothetical protein